MVQVMRVVDRRWIVMRVMVGVKMVVAIGDDRRVRMKVVATRRGCSGTVVVAAWRRFGAGHHVDVHVDVER